MLRSVFVSILVVLTWLPSAEAILLTGDTPPGMTREEGVANSWYEQGLAALAKNQLTAAQNAFEKSAQFAPDQPHPWLGMADVALRQHDASRAWTLLEKADAISNDDPQVKHAMARFHFSQRDYDKARDALQTVIELQPDNLLARLDIGNVYANKFRQPEQAIEAYRAALRINPQHAGAHHSLGMVLWQTGQADDAVAAFKKASELAPQNPLPLQAMGQLYNDSGEPQKALEAFTAATAAQPSFVPAHLRIGDIHLGQGDMNLALASYEKASQAAPKNAEAHLKTGMALQGLGEANRAEAAYLRAVQLNPKLALAYNNLAWMAAERRTNLEQALRWAQTAVQLAPQVPPFQDTLGWVTHLRGNTAAAIDILNRAKALTGATPDISYHLGRIFLEQKQTKPAEKAFRDALAIDPNYAPALQALQEMGAR